VFVRRLGAHSAHLVWQVGSKSAPSTLGLNYELHYMLENPLGTGHEHEEGVKDSQMKTWQKQTVSDNTFIRLKDLTQDACYKAKIRSFNRHGVSSWCKSITFRTLQEPNEWNGGVYDPVKHCDESCRQPYQWSQDGKSVCFRMILPEAIKRARQLSVSLLPSKLSVKANEPEAEILLDAAFFASVKQDESHWELNENEDGRLNFFVKLEKVGRYCL